MKDQFVPFEIAKRLKALKFDPPCLAWYTNKSGKFMMLGQAYFSHIHTTYFTHHITQAPLWQQVTQWLRDKHRIHIEIFEKYIYLIVKYKKNDRIEMWSLKPKKPFKTYDECLSVAIIQAIKLLEKE